MGRVDDAHVHAGCDRVIEKRRVHGLADRVVPPKAKREVRKAEDTTATVPAEAVSENTEEQTAINEAIPEVDNGEVIEASDAIQEASEPTKEATAVDDDAQEAQELVEDEVEAVIEAEETEKKD